MKITSKRDPEITITDLSPLHLLLGPVGAKYVTNEDDFIDIVQLLLKNGADVNAKTDYGVTPFHLLCENYQGDKLHVIAKLLIQNGAEVNAEGRGWNGRETPLQKLCYYYKNENLVNAVKLLIENGAQTNTKNGEGITYFIPFVPSTIRKTCRRSSGC